jgi:uncharacterized Fe-S cluster protein YjdI
MDRWIDPTNLTEAPSDVIADRAPSGTLSRTFFFLPSVLCYFFSSAIRSSVDQKDSDDADIYTMHAIFAPSCFSMHHRHRQITRQKRRSGKLWINPENNEKKQNPRLDKNP